MTETPGGICASYYVVPGEETRLHSSPLGEQAYRFEIGGGHWLWGGDALVLHFLSSFVSLKSYSRKAAVYLPDQNIFIPYPLQNHLSYLGRKLALQVLCEMLEADRAKHPVATMADWLRGCFGPTLCHLFFDPFHELYTAGLWREVAPQDESKSPVDLRLAIQGAFDETPQGGGYNPNFLYPTGGLNLLAQRMAEHCDVHYGCRVVQIDAREKTVTFADGTTLPYNALLCTLPLDITLKITGLEVPGVPDPFTSVMVVNIGARKGSGCPKESWLYIPRSNAGFHRVGFYSNVDSSFLPRSAREGGEHASIYVEKAYPGGQRPSREEAKLLCEAVVQELRAWDWIKEVEVVDPTWVETAYTWTWPGSHWRREAIRILETHGIYQLGRYGRWSPHLKDQGIVQSIRDGLLAGTSFRDRS
jgi:protoporphyrinogen oxidase